MVLDTFRARGWKLATAESCTGGLVTAALTDIAGSSDVVDRGFVTYSNEAKAEMLGVDPGLIASVGAVSGEVAAAMAAGALSASLADAAVSITGVAGPGGGSADKPVGTVWFGMARRDGTSRTVRCHFGGDRRTVRLASARQALEMLRQAAGNRQ